MICGCPKRSGVYLDKPDKPAYEAERSIIIHDFRMNGYPLSFLLKTEKDVKKNRLEKMVINDQPSFTDLSTSTPPVRRFCLPYINGWSEAVARICIEFDIQLTHRPINKLRYVWGNHKSYLPSHKNRNSIYQINCSDCSMLYIGESNNASRRLKEHEADFRLRRLNNSALASHALSLKHTPNFDSHKVLANDCFYRTRKFSESFFIQDTTNVMNIHPGSLPSSFLNSNLFKNF